MSAPAPDDGLTPALRRAGAVRWHKGVTRRDRYCTYCFARVMFGEARAGDACLQYETCLAADWCEEPMCPPLHLAAGDVSPRSSWREVVDAEVETDDDEDKDGELRSGTWVCGPEQEQKE